MLFYLGVPWIDHWSLCRATGYLRVVIGGCEQATVCRFCLKCSERKPCFHSPDLIPWILTGLEEFSGLASNS